jgi:2-polyprenyl-6-methoxyphenol hydroxylase-like FAD-dependent oxidoreductase
MSQQQPQGQQAIVLGASVGGLLAARTLSDYFQRVVVLERDALAAGAEPRKGVPQGRHTHGLLAGGADALERFFPGIREELVAQGAETGDLLGKALWHVAGGPHARFESGLIGLTQSRPMLEQIVRDRLAALPNVTLRDQVCVERLMADETKERIVGVQVCDRRANRSESLAADLIVDATGRGSRMPAWLESFGYPRPAEERVDVDPAYATRMYRRRPGDFQGLMGVVVTQVPPIKRFGVALAVEGDRWSLTLGGMFGDHPPTDPDGFRRFAAGLASPMIHEFLQHAEPLSEVAPYRMPGSLRRRYERLARFPERLIVMGDALCSFNPIYGQGMTTAALQAEALGQSLSGGLDRLAPRFFPRAAKLVDVAWGIAVTSDFQFPQTRGRKPRLAGLTNAYLRLIHQAARTDRAVALVFHRVANLLDPPGRLLRPAIIARVMRSWSSLACQRLAGRLLPGAGHRRCSWKPEALTQ